MSDTLQRVIDAIDQRADEIVEFAGELIRQPSVNPDLEPNEDAERPAQEWLRDRLATTGGYEIDYYEVAANRPNVVATRKGSGGGRSLIWAAHTDVVPVTPEQRAIWVGSGPFSGEVIDGKLYGRGASDMKGAIAAYVMAARILRDEGVELQGDLILAQSPGEEAGRRDIGCNTVLERGHRADFAIFPEPSNFSIYPTIKGELYFKLTVPGKSTHICNRQLVAQPLPYGMERPGVSAIDNMLKYQLAILELEKQWNLWRSNEHVPPGGREQTAFHARVLRDDVNLALDLVSDILVNPTFNGDELERERDVIIQEIGQTQDTPDDLIFDYLQEACFPNQPMGWPILGTEETVSKFSRNDLRSYMTANYRAGGMLLIASGAVEHERLADNARELFSPLQRGGAPSSEPARFRGTEIRDDRDLEQAHLSFAFVGVPTTDADVVTAQVFATALGGGSSSRLFQEAREKRGLCYSIYAFSQSHRDTGMIGIYAGTSEEKAGDVAPIIAGEIAAMAEAATEEEVARARAQLKATLLMALESPASRCERIAAHLFNFGRVLSVQEMTARLAAVDAAAIRRFAAGLCERGEPAMAAVGPITRLESHDRFARRFGREHALAGA